MAVRLQTAEGKIKKYKTVYDVGTFTGDLYYLSSPFYRHIMSLDSDS